MHTSLWSCILPFICVSVLGLRVPIKDVRELAQEHEKRAAAAEIAEVFHQHEKRLTCIYDGFLQGAELERDSAVPWCSTYLGIKQLTATSTVTAKVYVTPMPPNPIWTGRTDLSRYVTNVYTTIDTITDKTVTVTGSTSTFTMTAAPDSPLAKRQQSSIAAVPFKSLSSACEVSPLNQTVISKASSICSCLRIQPGTDYIPFTITSVTATRLPILFM